jgi:GH25 family lysozyme M1 (1,4-beta-N-acetylmuramidase)
MAVYGLDWSSLAGPHDARKLAGTHWQFATIQLTFGDESRQPTLLLDWTKKHAPRLAESGVPLVGGYHVLLPGNAIVQARWFHTHLTKYFGTSGYIAQLNWESLGRSRTATYKDAREWLTEWSRLTNNYPVALYVPRWFHAQIGAPSLARLGENITLWNSHYAATAAGPVSIKGWSGYGDLPVMILQYYDKGHPPGFTGDVGLNLFRGPLHQLCALLTRTRNPDSGSGWTYLN